jgi:hypothetical protein
MNVQGSIKQLTAIQSDSTNFTRFSRTCQNHDRTRVARKTEGTYGENSARWLTAI